MFSDTALDEIERLIDLEGDDSQWLFDGVPIKPERGHDRHLVVNDLRTLIHQSRQGIRAMEAVRVMRALIAQFLEYADTSNTMAGGDSRAALAELGGKAKDCLEVTSDADFLHVVHWSDPGPDLRREGPYVGVHTKTGKYAVFNWNAEGKRWVTFLFGSKTMHDDESLKTVGYAILRPFNELMVEGPTMGPRIVTTFTVEAKQNGQLSFSMNAMPMIPMESLDPEKMGVEAYHAGCMMNAAIAGALSAVQNIPWAGNAGVRVNNREEAPEAANG